MSKSPEELLKELEKIKKEIINKNPPKKKFDNLEEQKKELLDGIEKIKLRKEISKLKMNTFLMKLGVKK